MGAPRVQGVEGGMRMHAAGLWRGVDARFDGNGIVS